MLALHALKSRVFMSFIPFAVLSGVFASLSSVFAKLFSDQRTERYHDAIIHFITNQQLFNALSLTIDTHVRHFELTKTAMTNTLSRSRFHF